MSTQAILIGLALVLILSVVARLFGGWAGIPVIVPLLAVGVIADKYPQYKAAVLDAGQQAFVKGSQLGFAVGVTGSLLAIAITWFFFPRRDAELATYAAVAGE